MGEIQAAAEIIKMGAQSVQGLVKGVGSLFGGGKRRREERAAMREYNTLKNRYATLDTSNVYSGMENTMEDLTVNTQQADFLAQQQQQGLSNTMSGLAGAARGSGIAALAQAMANQQSQNLQGASASIGQQERQNQILAAQQASRIQELEGKGELASRDAKRETTTTLLGMAQQRVAKAKEARAAARADLIGGIGAAVGGIAGNDLAKGEDSNIMGFFNKFKKVDTPISTSGTGF